MRAPYEHFTGTQGTDDFCGARQERNNAHVMQPAVRVGTSGLGSRNRRILQRCRQRRPTLHSGRTVCPLDNKLIDQPSLQALGSPDHEIGDQEERQTGGEGRRSNCTRAGSGTNQPAEKHGNQRRPIYVPETGVETQHGIVESER